MYEWVKEKWAKDVLHELSIFLNSWESNEDRVPSLMEAIEEAKYALEIAQNQGIKVHGLVIKSWLMK